MPERPITPRRSACRTCGEPVVGGGKLCHLCSTRLGNPSHWSREEIVVAVRKWVRVEGWPPLQKDWRPVRLGGAKRWEAEFPAWPPAIAGKVVFGGWSQMLEAAGIQAHPPYWAPGEILGALRAYALEFGKPPAKRELIRPPTGYPLERTVARHFGSFAAGLLAAGLEPQERKSWTRDAVIEAMREFRRETGRWPKSTDWKTACAGWPSARIVVRFFGSWQEGVSRAANGAGR